MARIVVAAWPLTGHIHPCLAIARELGRRGHDVGFYTGEKMRALLERETFRLFPFDAVDEAAFHRAFLSRQRSMSASRPFAFMAFLQKWLADTLAAVTSDLENVLASWQPDLFIAEESMWAPTLILREKHDASVVVCSVIAGCLLPGRDVPLPGVGLAPPRGRTGRLCQRALSTAGTLLARPLRSRVNEVRRAHGLPPLSTSIREAVGNVPLYLVRGSPELDYGRRDVPPCVSYVGPLDYADGPVERPAEWVRDLPRDRPLVYVSEGTLHAGEPVVLRAAAEGLADVDVHVVMATGREREPEALGLGVLPPNVTVRHWVPQRELFQRTDAVVTVGGCGTVLGALAAGVPLVVVPVESDQPENARHVAEAGAGIAVHRRRCTPRRLREAVEHVLREPSFRSAARRLAASFERYRGAGRAADLIEQQLTRRSGGPDYETATGIRPAKVLH